MSDLKELEDKLQRKKYEKSVFEIIKNTFSLGIEEARNTLGKVVDTPQGGESQITKEIEEYEINLINKKK